MKITKALLKVTDDGKEGGGGGRAGGRLNVQKWLYRSVFRVTTSFMPTFGMLDSEIDSQNFIWKISKMQGNCKTKLNVYIQISTLPSKLLSCLSVWLRLFAQWLVTLCFLCPRPLATAVSLFESMNLTTLLASYKWNCAVFVFLLLAYIFFFFKQSLTS